MSDLRIENSFGDDEHCIRWLSMSYSCAAKCKKLSLAFKGRPEGITAFAKEVDSFNAQ